MMVLGSVVVHVALDYQALPFISSQSPYIEALRQTLPAPEVGQTGHDVELVVYGWGLQPIFTSGQSAWLLDDALFDRLYESREPFWVTRSKSEVGYNVYLVNNRAGIYALGYPVAVMFDHLVRLAETTTLVGLLFVSLVLITTAAGVLAPNRYRFGRALLREVRTSFYRRLFLAFVAATVIPVLALALVMRNYFTTQLRAGVEASAARTAAVAQRVIEESFGLQQTGEESPAVINDDLLVWISQIIDQDVNIFEGSQLLATSERDLFASGLLPTRTPDGAYDAITLKHMPSFVAEDVIGSLRYLVASTPIRTGSRDAILTVPLASRQQEIERQISDLDRGILLGVTLFILLGAGSGFYMAERIADPVKRLTRATGQVARGNFNPQVAVKSADELQQLVAAFNRMAIDLKEQQQKLERTHRLEAWAEMARQVAHEIKNPLTPVQLSAEHLLQVHKDHGEPLSPVLQSCVNSILTQVRILRQISAEFSSYASSPTVHREPTHLTLLVNEVMKAVPDRSRRAHHGHGRDPGFGAFVADGSHADRPSLDEHHRQRTPRHAGSRVARDPRSESGRHGRDDGHRHRGWSRSGHAEQDFRTVFFNQDVRYRVGYGDRQAKHRAQRWNHRGDKRKGTAGTTVTLKFPVGEMAAV